jgi:hypothetical protein
MFVRRVLASTATAKLVGMGSNLAAAFLTVTEVSSGSARLINLSALTRWPNMKIVGEFKTIEVDMGDGQRESVSPGEWAKAVALGWETPPAKYGR